MSVIKAPKQATLEAQEAAMAIQNHEAEEITLCGGKKIYIADIYPPTLDKIDDILVKYERVKQDVKDGKRTMQYGEQQTRMYFAKLTAAAVLNDKIKLKLWWAIKWRIIYNFWKYNGEDMQKIVLTVKKKSQDIAYLRAMAFSLTIPDIWTMMTEKEAEAFRQELSSAKEQQS